MGSPSWIIEKKFIEGQKGDDITSFDGTEACAALCWTFLFNPKTNRKKQKLQIWFAYYQNKSKTFWFGLEIVLGKIEHFYIIQKLIDRNKTLWFDPPIIGRKAKHFDLVRLLIWTLAFMFFLWSRQLNLTVSLLR